MDLLNQPAERCGSDFAAGENVLLVRSNKDLTSPISTSQAEISPD
jgi:hypothetical protein